MPQFNDDSSLEGDAMVRDIAVPTEKTRAVGARLFGGLASVRNATSVRMQPGGAITDGPYTETKEHVGGLLKSNTMQKKLGAIAIKSVTLFVVLCAAHPATAQEAAAPYPKMAPIEQYFMTDEDAEVALARSAAPDSISRDADVLILGRRGFETAVKGTNGFVCIVGRGWTAAPDPDFWNPFVITTQKSSGRNRRSSDAHTYILRAMARSRGQT